MGAPGRDETKLNTINLYLDRFYLAANSVPELTDKPALHEFWKLIEECRLAIFAPEVPLEERSPIKKLDKAWEELRF